ncbi:hypothetical protein VS873_24090, partial [Salmonella enterica subsp. enterica serovar Typhi]|nr:hypothetical protein [Salmonella enterica subsp. enterica serovar Typhi]
LRGRCQRTGTLFALGLNYAESRQRSWTFTPPKDQTFTWPLSADGNVICAGVELRRITPAKLDIYAAER